MDNCSEDALSVLSTRIRVHLLPLRDPGNQQPASNLCLEESNLQVLGASAFGLILSELMRTA